MSAALSHPDRLALLAAAFKRRRDLLSTLSRNAIADALRLAVKGSRK